MRLGLRVWHFVVPLGLEPRLFCTKNRRVASYTMGQLLKASAKVRLYIYSSKIPKKITN